MILASCWLRAGDVGALWVEDIDWERDLLRVYRPEAGRTDTFPLTADWAWAQEFHKLYWTSAGPAALE